jgi:hypothetical protein
VTAHASPPPTFRLEEALAVLERTPQVIASLLHGLPSSWLDVAEGPDTWSLRVIVGHLIHGERTDWIPRARMILNRGESATFEPFDRFWQLHAAPSSIENDLASFARLRAENLVTLAGFRLGGNDLARRGRHPDFGPVTLGELLATWVAHDLGHIAQIARVMAKRYTTDVGPWKAYLPVLSDRA